MLFSIVVLAVIATAAAILIGVFMVNKKKNLQREGAPDVKFITFEAEKRK